ncbi:MAG: hypothetical protein KDC38_14030, partial [Planctomycetes bacterium]|nr:hypothetical protein [Planctomycetota bacterium]
EVSSAVIGDRAGCRFDVTLRRLDDQRAMVVVDARPGAEEGRIRGEVCCNVNGLPMRVPVSGYQYSSLVWKPLQFLFSRIDDPSTDTSKVELYSPDGVAFEILEATYVEGRRPSAIQLDVEFAPRPGGGYVLTCRSRRPFPTAKGSLSGVIRVKTTHPERPEIEMRTIGYYTGKSD